jgi:hypothetical protein
MATRATAILAILAVAIISSATDATSPALEPADAAVIEWAQARFADAGMELPDVDIVVLNDLRDCGGHIGRYYTGRNLLELCRVDHSSVLHELAHAWTDLNLDDPARRAFVEHRTVVGWNDRGDAWEMRATEQAAEIIVWALMDRDTTVRWVEDGIAGRRLLSIPDSAPDRLVVGFELLTGQEVPGYRTIEDEISVVDFSPEARRR